ncbi:MAG: HD domain-containing phosphohydrolase, partial [Gemmatimonadaceae bacterium]
CLEQARAHELAGRVRDAADGYAAAVRASEAEGDQRALIEALRRLAVARHRLRDDAEAYVLCSRSLAEASSLGDDGLVAEALNTKASFDLEYGQIAVASEGYRQALALAADHPRLRARIEQNLGIIANIRGDLAAAMEHYSQSLAAFRSADDEAGCAIAYHNLGMISSDRRRWDEAERYFAQSMELAIAQGDEHLRANCLLNRTEVLLARGDFGEARSSAEQALGIVIRIGAEREKADAYRFLGIVYRETGSRTLAEARFKAAIEVAQRSQAVLVEAEASRELAQLYRGIGRNQDALRLLNAAHTLFGRIDARVDLVDVSRKVHDLEGVYMAVVRDWGQSIESADAYTYGHCERVAHYAVTLSQALGLPEEDRTAIHLGAYLHDVGKLRIPHEILNKPGRLTREEFAEMQLHTVYGVELLKDVEFPWDIKTIIRSHHEKYDGSGYPDALSGAEIPLRAQVICVVDVFDALTTTRSYRGAMPWPVAMEEMRNSKRFWEPAIFDAFMSSIPVLERAAA